MFDELKNYINQRITYTKLEVVDAVSNIVAATAFGIIIGMFLMLVLFVSSLSIGFLLDSWLDSQGLGFLILLGFYLIIILILYLKRKAIIGFFTDQAVRMSINAIDNSDDE